MQQTPSLYSPRLTLRPLASTDDLAIFRIRSNAEVAKYLGRAIHQELSETEAFIQKIMENQGNNSHYWAIDTGTDSCIGTICLWNFNAEGTACEIGYEMHPDFQGKGYAKESIAKVVDFGFKERGITRLEAWVVAENEVSIHLLKAGGFVFSHESEGLSVFVLA